MEKLSFYEQVGIVTPGSVFLFGVIFCNSDLKAFFAKDAISVGGLGIFIILSYALGHLLAAIGNFIEKVYWKFNRGMPSNWVIGVSPKLLTPSQITKIETLISSRLGITLQPLSTLTEKDWFPIFRQIYTDVENNGKSNRADIFNGNYGLNRGLCSATLTLSIVFFIQSLNYWFVSFMLLEASLIYLYRMSRFGELYAREVYNQFLLLSPTL